MQKLHPLKCADQRGNPNRPMAAKRISMGRFRVLFMYIKKNWECNDIPNVIVTQNYPFYPHAHEKFAFILRNHYFECTKSLDIFTECKKTQTKIKKCLKKTNREYLFEC